VQIGQGGWADTLAPSNFFQPLFSCASFLPRTSSLNGNYSEFCDPEIDARMRQAGAAQTTDPVGANRLWAGVDRALVDRAAVIPLGNRRSIVFVSDRVGNYQSHPLWGTLLDPALGEIAADGEAF
jgi:peptide/nickel transport system substrate-binding protein